MTKAHTTQSNTDLVLRISWASNEPDLKIEIKMWPTASVVNLGDMRPEKEPLTYYISFSWFSSIQWSIQHLCRASVLCQRLWWLILTSLSVWRQTQFKLIVKQKAEQWSFHMVIPPSWSSWSSRFLLWWDSQMFLRIDQSEILLNTFTQLTAVSPNECQKVYLMRKPLLHP